MWSELPGIEAFCVRAPGGLEALVLADSADPYRPGHEAVHLYLPRATSCTAVTAEATPTWFADREDSDQEAKEQGFVQHQDVRKWCGLS